MARSGCLRAPGWVVGLSPIDQLSAGTSNHFSDIGVICLHAESCLRWERHEGFAPVFVNPDLNYTQQVAPVSDSVLYDLPVFVGQMRLIASGKAEPAFMLCHHVILKDVVEDDYPLTP